MSEPTVAPGLTVTRAAPSDAEPLGRFFAHHRGSASNETFDPFELTAERARAIACEPSSDLFFLARLDGEIVALSMLRGFDEGYEIPSFGILVDQERQGSGIGRSLTTWTLRAARAQGCPAVRLSVYARNERAVALYESLGFVEQSRAPVDRGGTADHRVVMLLAWEQSPG